MDDTKLERLLRAAKDADILPSAGFESRFWEAVGHRRQSPWFLRWLEELQALVPAPMAAPMAATLLLVFLVGGATGTVSAMSERPASAGQSLSGFGEFKGLPTVSVTAAYLGASEKGQIS
ncbi:MAG: hypothetical protein HYT89_01585 [Candidatus Omnitrophica bacterium]|nr:hypothetical protein [Candidatus Omnitrophota bacterium]